MPEKAIKDMDSKEFYEWIQKQENSMDKVGFFVCKIAIGLVVLGAIYAFIAVPLIRTLH